MTELEVRSNNNGNPQQSAPTPQTAPQLNNQKQGAPAGSVQPGTANSLLSQPLSNQATGTPLQPTTVPSINLSTAATAVQQPAAPPAPKREIKPLMVALPLTLFILAIVLFCVASRTGKNNNI